jgi:hypothetical protein
MTNDGRWNEDRMLIHLFWAVAFVVAVFAVCLTIGRVFGDKADALDRAYPPPAQQKEIAK